MHDKDPDVRCAVAKQGFGLDILVHDSNEWVLFVVIEQGYGFDILKNDKSKIVRDIVDNELRKEEKPKSTEQEIDDDFENSSKHIAIKDSLMVGEIKAHLEEKSREFDRDLKRLEKEIENEDNVSSKEDDEDDI